MDVMRSPSQPAPTGLGLSMPSPQQDVSQPATTLSPARKAAREAKRRRASPPKVGTLGGKESATPTTLSGTKWTGKTRFASSATSKPLLPVTERKSQEEKNTSRRARGRGSDDKVDIAPDGGSAGRDGRQFTVANVGNNGRIYLRPSVRPAHQRYPQPNFVFPMTPPGTAGLDTLAGKSQFDDVVETMTTTNSLWTPSPSTPGTVRKQYFQIHSRRPTGHRRALSDSTIRDDSDVGAFKVVISKPGEDLNRPKTTEDIDASGGPLLDIDIPTWKIGNPRFTMKGTPFFRGSSYAPTEEMSRSSNVSFLRSQRGDLAPHSGETSSLRKPNPISIPQIRYPAVDAMRSPPITSARLPAPYRSTYLSTHLIIEPAMFDALTFRPSCDDRAIVRYATATGAVTAATPPRLVAEITSPTFLDYELISDFFLTYRAFLEPSDLLRMIVARLRWALGRDDEVGMVVRVRTFVAIRHWILNYFMDDFVIDYGLRVSFCNLLNDFVDELSQDARARKVQLKILAELKKCWRRVCAQYWDGPDFDSSLDPDEPIAPGGIAGHRNASLDPSFWENTDLPPRLSGLFSAVKQTAGDERSFYADVSRAGHIGDSHILGPRPSTPENQIAQEFEPQQTSPKSMASLDVVSCSFPGKIGRAVHPGSSNPMAVHPVPPSSVYTNAAAIATTPRALTGKRVRPSANHKRNGSLTDSLRERSHSTDKLGLNQDTEHLLSFPYAGSLVRGNLLPPGQPFVEILPPNMSSEQRETTIFQQSPLGPEKSMASAMSGPGMKRLIGSVRRALSTRGQGVSPTQGNFINISPIGPRGATTNRLPGTAIVPQARPHQNGVRPPVRIDLLGAEIAEDFKKAVREDAAAEAEQRDLALRLPADLPLHSAIPDEMLEYSAAHVETLLGSPSMANPIIDDHLRPMSDTGITTGSKSIVIVDDTLPFGIPLPLPLLRGLRPSIHDSVGHSEIDFVDNLLPTNADPTPPNTPPADELGTPRRSSRTLNRHAIRPSLSSDNLPPFVPDLATLGRGEHGAKPSVDTGRPSSDVPRPSSESNRPWTGITGHARPPLSGSAHWRQMSSKTNQSLNSILHQGNTSFRSDYLPPSTVRSFDATTYSEERSIADDDLEALPQPLRVLRRKRGGDLRAATNTGQLDNLPLHRTRSVGSLTTYSESIRSSYLRSPEQDSSAFVDVASSQFSPEHVNTFSLGVMAEQPPKRDLSLFSTHSSKPVMRPSFEAEAQKLAQIPDDANDDGGVESALAKLEGKYEKKQFKLSMEPTNTPKTIPAHLDGAFGGSDMIEKQGPEHLHLGDGVGSTKAPHYVDDLSSPSGPITLHVPRRRAHTDAKSFLSDKSGASYSSIPLLERGLTDDGRSKTGTEEWRGRSILVDPGEASPATTPRPSPLCDSQHPSYEFIEKTRSMDGVQSENARHRPSKDQSYLDLESEDDGTDLSSEMSLEVINSDDFDGEGSFPPMGRSTSVIKRMPTHPLADSGSDRESQLPSPPMTLAQALQMSPETAKVPQLHEHQLWSSKPLPLPPTPDTTPTAAQYPEDARNASDDVASHVDASVASDRFSRKFSVHLPFILAFDSEILAQQFTLIEKDALNEIDWKELIEMGWKNATNNDSRSWVDFLRNTDAHGVEVVIARFNIMVKWACSEIVLTQNIEERARCIIKFIHLAAHCHRFRNFATMSQIAIALTSQEVARLSKTWAMVPRRDMQTLQELELLVSPTRNFHNLRAEMEGGSDSGCIPFVGIYTHDLLFNAQRPSEIASSPTTAPLVNFERCRYAATIVKTLLRLLEASTLYQFQPVEGITERCLWMGALTDEEIRRHSESLE
ncbi:guanine nucleotide exchange factor LTE1 [Verticillium dahliae]|nr:guanine nucleotide exchange factor LTE1 [Verticillium dahliae]PNH49519.1 hypothetical protein VD0003_g7620 [Verticillium dahliae]